MKLSNQQLDALVSKIYNNSKQEDLYKIKCKECKVNPKTIALANKYEKTLNSIPEKIRNKLYIKTTNNQFLDAIVQTTIVEPPLKSRTDIKNEILIASIDSETFNELQEKLKIKL